ncbi:hypothetical protein EIN_110670 [Entamoeba invadens IP1]|uniref:Uncharacterized protein n=1 Tax=Entamoeba invadens IP1 TaxID=370355 RepID=A0A0A1TXV2_ENTIV|nr:hypothetical protein EIN_110670 [Entamoeba invadens IP1]ELP86223.1 hypothetical protein EIN_110670 [Entamoeba invadens IP1]|eukprot:XP_004185569.1 hypothetical protein EIN_110670 [Entamoeba invadens IP1]
MLISKKSRYDLQLIFKQCDYYTLMADSAMYSGVEYFSLFVRFVFSDGSFVEKRVKIENYDGKTDAAGWLSWIMKILELMDADLIKCIGACFDGAYVLIRNGGLSGKFLAKIKERDGLNGFDSNYCFSHKTNKATEKCFESQWGLAIESFLDGLTVQTTRTAWDQFCAKNHIKGAVLKLVQRSETRWLQTVLILDNMFENLPSLQEFYSDREQYQKPFGPRNIMGECNVNCKLFVACMFFTQIVLSKVKIINDWLQTANLLYPVAYQRVEDLISNIFELRRKVVLTDYLEKMKYTDELDDNEKFILKKYSIHLLVKLGDAMILRFAIPSRKMTKEDLFDAGLLKENQVKGTNMANFGKLQRKLKGKELVVNIKIYNNFDAKSFEESDDQELKAEVQKFQDWYCANIEKVEEIANRLKRKERADATEVIRTLVKQVRLTSTDQTEATDIAEDCSSSEIVKEKRANAIQHRKQIRALFKKTEDFLKSCPVKKLTLNTLFALMSQEEKNQFPCLFNLVKKMNAKSPTTCPVERSFNKIGQLDRANMSVEKKVAYMDVGDALKN